jgi:hypothetical protein
MSTEFTNIEVFHASFLLLQMTRVLFCALATCFDEFGNGMGKNDNNFDAGSLQCGGNVCRFPVEKKRQVVVVDHMPTITSIPSFLAYNTIYT